MWSWKQARLVVRELPCCDLQICKEKKLYKIWTEYFFSIQELYKAGEDQWGTDESRFNVILMSRSYAQLRATFAEYTKISKHDIEAAIKKEMSGDLKTGMLTVGKFNREFSWDVIMSH